MNLKKFAVAVTVVLGVFMADKAQAAPVFAQIHPGGALVRDETTLNPDKDQRTLRLTLPPAADAQSLDIDVPGRVIAALRIEDAATSDQYALTALRKEIDEVRGAILSLQIQQADLEARRAYWRKPPVRFDVSAPMADVDAMMASRLESFRQESVAQALAMEKLQERSQLLNLRLEQSGGYQPLTKQAVIELAEPASGPVLVRSAYTIHTAGWRPMYRVEALPDSGEVRLSLEAEIWQGSGEDWSNVPLVLSTADPRQGMSPPRLAEWILQPQVRPTPRQNALMMDEMPQQSMELKMEAVAAAPRAQYSDSTSYEAWDLGKRSLPAGPPQRVSLSTESIKADFVYLVRPSRSEAAYLSAKLVLPELRNFPAGEALFLVDGVIVGRAPFSLAMDDSRVFFGLDPQVGVTMKKNSQQGGRQGFIDRKQTYGWDWTITVYNRHTRPIRVRVEDPQPQSRDEQIVLSVTSKPEAKVEDHVLVWEMDLPAGKSADIQHVVTLTAPPDMDVWKGR